MRISPRSFRPKALVDSFFGIIDIKSGAELILLFGIMNKVAGIYGLISVFTGGTLVQLSFYLYSVVTMGVLLWGLKAVSEESTTPTLLLSHLYALDHFLQTLYLLSFSHTYYTLTPHDGRRVVSSQAQEDLVTLALSRGEITVEEATGGGSSGAREQVARGLWEQEKGTAAAVLLGLWVLKIYFIIILYSYASHLRSNTYHSLPLSTPSRTKPTAAPAPSTAVNGGKAAAEGDFEWDSEDEERGGDVGGNAGGGERRGSAAL